MAKEKTTSLRCDETQYKMLMRCSAAKDMSEWNNWRKMNRLQEILLEGAEFENAYLKDADFHRAQMKEAIFHGCNLETANFRRAQLEFAEFDGNSILDNARFIGANCKFANFEESSFQNSVFKRAHLEEAYFDAASLDGADMQNVMLSKAKLIASTLHSTILNEADLRGAIFDVNDLRNTKARFARVDGDTIIKSAVMDSGTNFLGVGLDAARIDPGLKAALKDNIRRIQWQKWLRRERKKGKWNVPWLWPWPVKWFWWVTDYGSSTKRIIGTFFALAAVFCLIYWLFAMVPGSQSVIDELRKVAGPDNSTVSITFGCLHTLIRAFYFSVVTMTTLGFGDMHAATTGGWPSYVGYILLTFQVLLGYVFLGALITRLGILFTGEAPAAAPTPAKAKGKKDD